MILGQIAMTVTGHIHTPQRMNPIDFSNCKALFKYELQEQTKAF